MSAWRRTALDCGARAGDAVRREGLARQIEHARDVDEMWSYVSDEFDSAHVAPRDDSFIAAVYELGRELIRSDDPKVSQSAVFSFWEDLPLMSHAFAEAHNWIRPSELADLGQVVRYHLHPEEFETFRKKVSRALPTR